MSKDDNNDKKDRSHLKVVETEKDQPQDKDDKEVFSTVLYDEISRELTDQFFSEWDEYMSEKMGREDFIRTVIELDDLEFVHPFIVFDNKPAPTSNKAKLTPEKYSILDMNDLSNEEEDAILWNLECEGKNYRVIYIPIRLMREIETKLHRLIKQIIEESEFQTLEDFDPTTVVALLREYRIIFNSAIHESGMLNDDEYDDDYDDDDDEEYNEEYEDEFDEEFYDDEEFNQEDFDMIHEYINKKMEALSLNLVEFGRYRIILIST